jgi:hypothetical protein
MARLKISVGYHLVKVSIVDQQSGRILDEQMMKHAFDLQEDCIIYCGAKTPKTLILRE